ncbi:MAG: aromatic amino acid lyase, partial [Pseudomonadota bacterium]
SRALDMMRAAAVLSYDGYAANRQIFDDDVNALRVSPGQREAAAWFRDALEGTQSAPRRIQEALSFRTVAVVFGAADDALRRAIAVFEDELNGCADSPVVTDAETMVSTANYMTPGLGLALENLSLALVGVAHASAQRQQKLMHPDFSALPKYLAAPESAAAGFVPSQKTAASLLAEIKLGAAPALPDAPGVSDAVEDVASTTPQSARKLAVQLAPFELLAALEALVAAQAMDLRGLDMCGGRGKFLHGEIRKVAAFVEQDRMLGPDIEAVRRVLRMHGSVHH